MLPKFRHVARPQRLALPPDLLPESAHNVARAKFSKPPHHLPPDMDAHALHAGRIYSPSRSIYGCVQDTPICNSSVTILRGGNG